MKCHPSVEYYKGGSINVKACSRLISAFERLYGTMSRSADYRKDNVHVSVSEASGLDSKWKNMSADMEEKICKSVASSPALPRSRRKAYGKVQTNEEEKEGRECSSFGSMSSLESVHVQRVYDQIAPHIEDMKQRTWPQVKEFVKSLKAGSLVADIGCGNGRYLHINPSIFKVGSDVCLPFLQMAAARGFEVLSADNLLLPFRDSVFDAVISVGVIHHFASKERRVRALQELVRILLPGGRVMVYVWAFEQKYRKFDSQDILVPWHKPRQSDSGCGRLRTSSVPDVDRLSTSSTGSSVSDEEFTSCACHHNNLNPDICQRGLADPCLRCQCADTHENQEKVITVEDTFHQQNKLKQDSDLRNVKITRGCSADESDNSADSIFNRSSFESKLSKGEALIRECQKVEAYLSSLCKSTWKSSPERTKSASSVLRNTGSLGSFEEGTMTSTTKSSLSWQSLSLQDDEVFVEDKFVSPVLDNAGEMVSSPTKQTEGKQLVMACSADNQSSTHKEDFIFWKTAGKKHSHETKNLPLCHDDKMQAVHLQEERTDELSSAFDDTDIVDFERVVPVNGILSGHSQKMKPPRGMLDMLKQGFKNMLSKAKQENGRKAASCVVPCFDTAFPQEQFRIREFPQSSLPSDVVLEKRIPRAIGSSTNQQDGCLNGTVSCEDDAEKRDDLLCQTYSQNCFTYHDMKECSESHNITKAAYSKDSLSDGIKSDSQSSTPDPEITEYRTSTSRTFSCKGPSTPVSKKSKSSRSFKRLPKSDAVNADLCRFYHVFRKGELEELIGECVPGVMVVDSFYDHANWCVILEKC